jgi:hypothetical protein
MKTGKIPSGWGYGASVGSGLELRLEAMEKKADAMAAVAADEKR